MIIPIPEFAPDQPDVPSTSSDTVFNVIPATAQSYGPFPSLQSFSTALSARAQGALSVSDISGAVRVFAGDATKLYRLTSASLTPADVSKTGAYTTSSSGGWYFTLFGSRVIATNYNDAIQSYVEGVSTKFADMITSGLTTLKAKYAVAVRDFIMLGNTTETSAGTCPQRVHWSAINDPSNFPTPGTQAAANALSDFQDIPGPHGQLKGIAGNLGSASAGLFFERAVWRCVWAGQPDIFDFAPAEGARGLLADGGLTQLGPIAFYPGEDGFYAFDGSASKPIGKNKIDRFFYNDVQSSYIDRITSAIDPQRGLVVFAYPGVGAANGVPNRILVYSPYLDKWTATEIDAQKVSCLVRGATFNQTLEGLNAIGTLDALSFSLDSPAYAGGRSLLAGFDSANKYGYFDGAALAPKVDTSDIELISGQQTLVSRVRPLVDNASVTVSAAGRKRVQDAVSFGSAASIETNGTACLRSLGRYQRFRQQVPAATVWNHISGIDIEEAVAVGAR